MSTTTTAGIISRMLDLSHQLGREDRQLAILGEGNTSARLAPDTFVVKASGSNLGTLNEAGTAVCRFDRLLPLLDRKAMTDAAIDEALFAARVDANSRKPSVEAMFHAWLLTLPGVNFVGHTHPVAVNKILCTKHARAFATKRGCPDEIVCCGAEFVLVPYIDPGLKLAQGIRRAVVAYIKRLSRPPRVILLENHGLIALGATPEAVLAATLMANKAAEIFAGAVTLGSPRFLSAAVAARIAGRPDEHYRQQALGL
ncbi:class II aldolase/adducin family protein [Opitutus sp. GAS368]|uniref:class II aldolase/adducin family protein n=1 Tax=Opitutus sp. GAS368 TaxID=1882749 RepID=UPI00087AD7C1|nr:class II aldolase/adducin family protein [Opitutus sp. GAS368]SDS36235.1 Class II Aldolase and Adducin N-terminal domain-containing protein [Opitutus sp. GAS368]